MSLLESNVSVRFFRCTFLGNMQYSLSTSISRRTACSNASWMALAAMRLRLLLISCSAAMAEAAVTPPVAMPREKSFAPDSSFMPFRMERI